MSNRHLGDYVDLQRGTTYKSRLLGTPGPVLLGLASIARDGGFRADKLTTYGGASPENLLVRPGDLFVSLKDVTQSGDLLGAVARMPRDVPLGRLTQDTVRLVQKPGTGELEAALIYWVLRAPEYRAYCRAHATGTTNLGLAREDFLAFKIPALTPARMQLLGLLEAIESKIGLNRKMNETLEQMAQAIFKSWFIDFDGHTEFQDSPLGPIPKGWRVGSVQEIQARSKSATAAGPFGSKLTRKHYTPTGVPVIRGVNLSGPGWFHDNDFVYVSEEYAQELETCSARRGDVLFTQRGTLGQVGLIPDESRHARYILSQSQMKLTCAEWMPSVFIFFLFRLPSTIDYIKSNSVAAGVPHINLGFLRSFRLVIPPAETLRGFRLILEPIERKLRANSRESGTLAELRDILLPKLISGEIRIKDAEKQVGEAT